MNKKNSNRKRDVDVNQSIENYVPDKQKMIDFIRTLHGTEPAGYLNVSQYSLKGQPKAQAIEYIPAQDVERFIDTALSMQQQNSRLDNYFGVCTFKTKGSREAKNAHSAPGVFLDLDTNTGTHAAQNLPADPLEAFDIVQKITGKKPTIAVNTYGGIHVYFLFERPFIVENEPQFNEIRQLMYDFESAFQLVYKQQYGYKADSVCEPARILRIPGMITRKYNKIVEYMHKSEERFTMAEIRAIIQHMRKLITQGQNQLTEEPQLTPLKTNERTQQNIKADKQPDKICNQCAFMAHWRDDAAELAEPEWYAGITILSCDDVIDGQDFIHEYSSNYPGYSYAETQAKIEHARRAAPRTCERIAADTTGEYCAGCPHFNTWIKSPVNLGSISTIEEEFSVIVDEATEEATAEEQAKFELEQLAYMNSSAGLYVKESFISQLEHSANIGAISTGFTVLDEVLDGGFYPGLYFIGAISSLGKTTITMQIADQVAQAGHDVLVFSLEMSGIELIAKSLSRLTFTNDITLEKRNAKTTRRIMNVKEHLNFNPHELRLLNMAIEEYSQYGERIFIREGVGDLKITDIKEAIEKHKQYTGKVPLVIIDYLQIIAPYDMRASDKQNTDKAVTELKRISRDLGASIIGISSFNRDNYSQAVNMAAFKESGAIEYSSDVLIGLQLKGAGQKGFDVDAAKRKPAREVELKILKNRNGRTGDTIEYEYYPRFNHFKEISLSRNEVKATPKNKRTFIDDDDDFLA